MTLTDTELNALRTIGDPVLERKLAPFGQDVGREYLRVIIGGGLLAPSTLHPAEPLQERIKEAWDIATTPDGQHEPPQLDARLEDDFNQARELFGRFGPEIAGSLLLAALPQAYATAWGARVLTTTTQLQSNLQRRIRATAQFVVTVMTAAPDGKDVKTAWAPGNGSAWMATRALRVFHHFVRTVLKPSPSDKDAKARAALRELGPKNSPPNVPLNQEDLLGTLLTFTVTVFEVLERFGITWTPAEQQAYLSAWGVVGLHLGIADDAVVGQLTKLQKPRSGCWNVVHPSNVPDARGLRARLTKLQKPRTGRSDTLHPSSVPDARGLLARLRNRQWLPVSPFEPLKKNEVRDHIRAVMTLAGSREGEALDMSVQCAAETLEDVWAGLAPGRVLVRALLSDLESAMPMPSRSWPLAVMRQLAPEPVRDRLALGGGGIVSAVVERLPPRRMTIAPFTSVPTPSPIGGRLLRVMANEVTRRAVVRYIRSGDGPEFVIPGLEEWSSGLRTP
jgi:ER-bound oxygenase mpaB/B'/Rubber oxygenase, catalytic domain